MEFLRSRRPRGATPGPGAVPRGVGRIGAEWARLGAPTVAPETFSSEDLVGLPEPATRWLTHVVAPGTPLWRTAEITMVGRIRLGRWWPFTATQVVRPGDGYVWAADVRVCGVPLVGFDRLSSGTGEMRWSLLDRLPVVNAHGPDVTRSAAGRLASEIVLLPTAFRTAVWGTGAGPDCATARWDSGGHADTVSLRVDPTGRARDVVTQRWGDPGGEPFGRYPFGVGFEEERTYAGVTLPVHVRAGWWWGTARQQDGEFFRATITHATFR